MENLSKTQLILLVLLVTFVTSVATGIVTVTLFNQAPPPITNTINRVIEKTIGKVSPEEIKKIIGDEIGQDEPLIMDSKEELMVNIIENVSSSVASVVATKDIPVIEQYYVSPFGNDPFFQQFFQDLQIPQYRQKGTEKTRISSGTGFFVSDNGLILTNKHVVEDTTADYTVVLNDGRKLSAKVLVRDPFQDIAILQVEGKDFKPIPLGDSGKIKIGQTVIAIGNALGEFQNTVSTGIVSGLNRTVVATGSASGPEELQGLIQTDAAINKGNSGGPLLNISGEVIGINSAMAQNAENIGFSIPINFAKRDIADVKEFGAIKYPYIGIRYLAITAEIKKEKKLSVDYGLLLARGQNGEPAITPDSPAEKAGLKENDVILEINGAKIDQNNSLALILSKRRVGEKITFKILRDGKNAEISLTLEERPENI